MFLWHCPGVTPTGRYPASCPMELGLSSARQRRTAIARPAWQGKCSQRLRRLQTLPEPAQRHQHVLRIALANPHAMRTRLEAVADAAAIDLGEDGAYYDGVTNARRAQVLQMELRAEQHFLGRISVAVPQLADGRFDPAQQLRRGQDVDVLV